MKSSYQVRPDLRVEVEAATQKDLFTALAQAREIFGETCCGLCGDTAIVPVARTVTQGKKVYDYHEWHCLGCGARLSLGSHMEGGTLFPQRKLDAAGKPDREHGSNGDHRGWTHWRGEPSAAAGNGKPATGTQAPATPRPGDATAQALAASATKPATPPPAPTTPVPTRAEPPVQVPGEQGAPDDRPITAAQWDQICAVLKSRFITPAAFLRRYGKQSEREIRTSTFAAAMRCAQEPDDELRAANKGGKVARR